MKKILIPLICAVLTSAALAADVEKTTTTTTTTVGNGTITEYTPGATFVVKESAGPVTYHYGKEVIYETRGGKRLSDDDVRTRIKVGLPVHVHYSRDGERRVITRVIVDE